MYLDDIYGGDGVLVYLGDVYGSDGVSVYLGDIYRGAWDLGVHG